MIQEVPYPYMDLRTGVPPGSEWLSEVQFPLVIHSILSDSLVFALSQWQHVHLIVPRRLWGTQGAGCPVAEQYVILKKAKQKILNSEYVQGEQ